MAHALPGQAADGYDVREPHGLGAGALPRGDACGTSVVVVAAHADVCGRRADACVGWWCGVRSYQDEEGCFVNSEITIWGCWCIYIQKIFEKFDSELNAKKDIEIKVSQYLEEKFNSIGLELQNQSKIRYDAVDNLENYFEKELPKIQSGFKIEQNEREDGDNNILIKLSDEAAKVDGIIQNEKKSREETQEGILEMIKIMNDRMKNDLAEERKEREQNEEALIDVLENTCNRLQQTTANF